jgi:ABC-2 type transport system ATP-binding protein
MGELVILVEGLRKSFGSVQALRGVDFAVPEGRVLGLLGPNGAGKTTAVRILTTLLRPSGGKASVCGYDVAHHSAAVRRMIGLAGQATAITPDLTGRENLEIAGRLYHLGRQVARQRASELLERFDLADAADRQAKTYSGGMLRRLDLAASLIARPRALFLDEPTIGLDPRSRLGMWDIIRELVAEGTTLLLTTQYLDEADELADEIVVIDHGLVIASGTSETLKDRIGGDVVEFTVTVRSELGAAAEAVAPLSEGPPTVDNVAQRVQVHAADRGSDVLVEVVRALDAAGVATAGLALRRPSLDDVFLSLTGHAAEEAQSVGAAGSRGRGRGGQARRGRRGASQGDQGQGRELAQAGIGEGRD